MVTSVTDIPEEVEESPSSLLFSESSIGDESQPEALLPVAAPIQVTPPPSYQVEPVAIDTPLPGSSPNTEIPNGYVAEDEGVIEDEHEQPHQCPANDFECTDPNAVRSITPWPECMPVCSCPPHAPNGCVEDPSSPHGWICGCGVQPTPPPVPSGAPSSAPTSSASPIASEDPVDPTPTQTINPVPSNSQEEPSPQISSTVTIHTPSLPPSPSQVPSQVPSQNPSEAPSLLPSPSASQIPSQSPSSSPAQSQSPETSSSPVASQSAGVTPSASSSAQVSPSLQASQIQSASPVASASRTATPGISPSAQPSQQPSTQPSQQPSLMPSSQPSQQPSNQPSPGPSANNCIHSDSSDYECGKPCKCYTRDFLSGRTICSEYYAEKFCSGNEACDNSNLKCYTGTELCKRGNFGQNEPIVRSWTLNSSYNGQNFDKDNENKYCCNNSLRPYHSGLTREFRESYFEAMLKGTAPYPPHNNDYTTDNGNEFGKCAPPCTPDLQNHIYNKFWAPPSSNSTPVFSHSTICARGACDKNGVESSNAICDMNTPIPTCGGCDQGWCSAHRVINPPNFQFFPMTNDGPGLGTASASMCRFEDSDKLNGNRYPAIVACNRQNEGSSIRTPSDTRFIYAGSGNEESVDKDGRIKPKTYHCCKSSCDPLDQNKYQWFEKPYQGAICSETQGKVGECYKIDEDTGFAYQPLCEPETESGTNLSSCPVLDYVPPTCNVRDPSSCKGCKKCKKPTCPTCDTTKQKLNNKTGECECLASIVLSCNRSGGSLNDSCNCEVEENPNPSSHGFSISAYNSRRTDLTSGSNTSSRPMLSDTTFISNNIFDLIDIRRSSDLSDYRQSKTVPTKSDSIASDPTSSEEYTPAGYLLKICPIGQKRSEVAPFNCKPIMNTSCADGRISSGKGDCSIKCVNPNNPNEKDRNFCECITEACCSDPKKFDPILKICTCQDKFIKKLDNAPYCPTESTLDKNECWCKKSLGDKKIDWEKPECKIGVIDGASCACYSPQPELPIYGLKTFSNYSCKHECSGNDALSDKQCRDSGGEFNSITCECKIYVSSSPSASPFTSVSPSPSASPSPILSPSPTITKLNVKQFIRNSK